MESPAAAELQGRSSRSGRSCREVGGESSTPAEVRARGQGGVIAIPRLTEGKPRYGQDGDQIRTSWLLVSDALGQLATPGFGREICGCSGSVCCRKGVTSGVRQT